VLVLAGGAAHGVMLSRGLVWDDPLILNHMRLTGFWRLFEPDYFGFIRPGKVLLFSLAAHLFGSWAPGWQALSLLILMTASLVLLRFAREFLPAAGALAAALVYTVHPLHVEATGWFSAMNGTALVAFALSYYLSMMRLAATGGFRADSAALATVWLAGALLMKEDAVVLPVLALLCIVARHGSVPRAAARVWALHLLLVLAFTAFNRLAARNWGQDLIPPIYPEWVLSLHAARSFFEHVFYFVMPFRWAYYTEYNPRPAVLLPMLVVGLFGALGLAAWLLRRPRHLDQPRLFVLMSLIPMLPVLNIIYTGNNLFGVRYLAHGGTGLALLGGWFLTRAQHRGGMAWRIARMSLVCWITGAMAASCVFHVGWRNDAALFGNLARAMPWHPYAWTMLARDAYNAGQYRSAEQCARQASKALDELDQLFLAEEARMRRLGLAALAPVTGGEVYDPANDVVLAMALRKQGRHEEAFRVLRIAAARAPKHPAVMVNLAFHYDNQYFATGDARARMLAIRYYSRAARSRRDDGETAFVNLGLIHAADGQTTRAIEIWKRGLRRFPGSRDLRHNLQVAEQSLNPSGTLNRAAPLAAPEN
jgi:tetratricopeptide (TPR) repeat protein